MFRPRAGFGSFAVDDMAKAKKFYGDKLGLHVDETPMGSIELKFGAEEHVLVYEKPDHKPATFTVLNFVVPDIEEAVDALHAAGVKMEQYDMPQIKTDAKGIARDDNYGGPVMAWFQDPAGNILAVMQLPEDAS